MSLEQTHAAAYMSILIMFQCVVSHLLICVMLKLMHAVSGIGALTLRLR